MKHTTNKHAKPHIQQKHATIKLETITGNNMHLWSDDVIGQIPDRLGFQNFFNPVYIYLKILSRAQLHVCSSLMGRCMAMMRISVESIIHSSVMKQGF